MPQAGDLPAVEVGVGEALHDHAAVVCRVAFADDVLHSNPHPIWLCQGGKAWTRDTGNKTAQCLTGNT